MKKIFSLILILALSAAMACSAFAAGVPRLTDNAGIIDPSYYGRIGEYLDEKSEELGFEFVVLTESTIGGADIESYADDFADRYFDENGFPYDDSERDGIVLVIDMDSRQWWYSTSGFGITVFGDEEYYALDDVLYGDLSDGSYGKAVYDFAQLAAYYVGYAKEYGFDFSEDGYYTHDDGYPGGYESEPMPVKTKLGISGAIGAFVSMLSVFGMKGKMNTVHKKAAAGDYIRRGSLNIYRSNDMFINKTVARTLRYNDSRTGGGGTTHHGGGSVHISSGGHSHGGHGGHF